MNNVDFNQSASGHILSNTSHKPKKNYLKFFIIVFVVLVLAAGLVYAGRWGYYKYFLTPEKIIAKAIEKTLSADSYRFDFELSFKDRALNIENTDSIYDDFINSITNFSIKYSGAVNDLNKEPASYSSLYFKTLRAGESAGLDVDLKLFDNEMYIKFNELFVKGFVGLNKDYKGVWIRISNDNINTSLFDMIGKNLDPDDIKKLKKVAKIIKDNLDKIFVIQENKSMEEIQGIKAYRYTVGLVGDELKDMYIKILETIDIGESEQNDVIAAINNFNWKELDDRYVDLWIGKDDFYIYKIQFSESILSLTDTLNINEGSSGDRFIITTVSGIQTALDSYFADNNRYPITNEKIRLPVTTDFLILCKDGFQESINDCGDSKVYLRKFFYDPYTVFMYQSIDGKDYTIEFELEDGAYEYKAGKLVATKDGIKQVSVKGSDREYMADLDVTLDITLDVTVNFKDFNKNIRIDKPTEYKDLEGGIIDKILEPQNMFLGGFGSEEMLQDSNMISDIESIREVDDMLQQNTDSDNDGLSDEEEKMLGTDPQNPDTDGDGYTDGEEVRNGYSPLVPANK